MTAQTTESKVQYERPKVEVLRLETIDMVLAVCGGVAACTSTYGCTNADASSNMNSC